MASETAYLVLSEYNDGTKELSIFSESHPTFIGEIPNRTIILSCTGDSYGSARTKLIENLKDITNSLRKPGNHINLNDFI